MAGRARAAARLRDDGHGATTSPSCSARCSTGSTDGVGAGHPRPKRRSRRRSGRLAPRPGRALRAAGAGAAAVRRSRLAWRLRERPSARSRTGCRSCSSRRRPTSSTTPPAARLPARRSCSGRSERDGGVRAGRACGACSRSPRSPRRPARSRPRSRRWATADEVAAAVRGATSPVARVAACRRVPHEPWSLRARRARRGVAVAGARCCPPTSATRGRQPPSQPQPRKGFPPLELSLGVRDDAEARELRRAVELYEAGRRHEAARIFARYDSLEAKLGAAFAAWPASRTGSSSSARSSRAAPSSSSTSGSHASGRAPAAR